MHGSPSRCRGVAGGRTRSKGKKPDATLTSSSLRRSRPKTTAGAAFQIMCVSAEVDILIRGADEPHARKAAESRIERLLYRSLDGLRSEAEFPNARAYMMPQELDPKLKIN